MRLASHAASRIASSPFLRRGLASASSPDRLVIFDTSLRDGEQTPGVTLGLEEKVIIASKLSALGVDVCEAGFPIASSGDFEAVKAIAESIGNETAGRTLGEPMTICGLARAKEADITRCYEAVQSAKNHRIHTFLATSDIHLKYKLQISRDECLEQIAAMVKFAKSLCDDIEFSPEDAGRSDRDFLVEALGVAIEAGASTLNIPDTVGYNTPDMYGNTIKYLIDNVPGGHDVIFSTHCHDDLGLATANTLAGVVAGARQVEVTVNGIGERAGNTSLEEVVMATKVHPDEYNVETHIVTQELTSASAMVSQYTGVVVQPNKAIIGSNAFAHESGIHQDGVLKHQETYEIMKPETVGLVDHDNMVLGKLSGRNGFRNRLTQLGYQFLDDAVLDIAFAAFKDLCDSKKVISDGDLHAIVRDALQGPTEGLDWTLVNISLQASSSGYSRATATVSLKPPNSDGDEAIITKARPASSSIVAVYSAIDDIMCSGAVLKDYTIQSVTPGSDALGTVVCQVSPPGRTDLFRGEGSDSDVLVASAKAYVNACNLMLFCEHNRKQMQSSGKTDLSNAPI